MAKKPSAGLLTKMAETEESTFFDTCKLYSFTGTVNAYGEEISNYITGTSVPCGFAYGSEMKDESGQVVILTEGGTLRVSLNMYISVKDKVEVRGKKYDVDGVVDGITVQVVNLKELNTNE